MEPVGTRTQDTDVPQANADVHFDMLPVTAPNAAEPLTLPSIQIPEAAPTPTVPPPPPPAPPPPPPPPPVAQPQSEPQSATIVADVAVPPTPPSAFASTTSVSTPGHGDANVESQTPLPMLPVRLVALTGVALAFVLYGWQTARVIDEQPRLEALALGSLLAGAIGIAAVVLWTFLVVENARRVMDPARTQEPPRPGHAVTTWIVPIVFIVAAASAVSYLSRRLNSPIEGTESSFPLVLALISIFALFPLMYSPITYLSSVVRRIGGHGIKLAEWLWVPVILAGVGAAMVLGLRAGGAFGENSDALAPTWVIAVAAIVPAVVVVLLGWRAAAAVETDVIRAFERRHVLAHKTSTKVRRFGAMLADGGPNHAALRDRGHIRQIPAVRIVGLVITTGLAALSLISLIGAVVMFLFWQETRNGTTQTERAWDVLALLQSVERPIALVVVAFASFWTFAAVSNVRMASARRRNPILAALMWPAAAAAVWLISDRLVVEGDAVSIIAGFAAQAVALYLPFGLLHRSADAVNVRRHPIWVTYAAGVVLLVHIQGLAGLSTLSETSEPAEVGRLAGYLAIGALLQLVATFSATESTRSISDAAENLADHHNTHVEERHRVEEPRIVPEREVGPSVGVPPHT